MVVMLLVSVVDGEARQTHALPAAMLEGGGGGGRGGARRAGGGARERERGGRGGVVKGEQGRARWVQDFISHFFFFFF